MVNLRFSHATNLISFKKSENGLLKKTTLQWQDRIDSKAFEAIMRRIL